MAKINLKVATLGTACLGLVMGFGTANAQTNVQSSSAVQSGQKIAYATPTQATNGYVSVPAVQNLSYSDNVVLPGLANVPRHNYTAAFDGCQKVQKGLIMGGGFLVFTCEKLLPSVSIKKHKTVFNEYKQTMIDGGWTLRTDQKQTDKKVMFKKTDMTGCESELDISLWTDRSMNEPPRDAKDRNNHRQIVFMARYYGDTCEHYYPVAEMLAMNGN